MVAHLSSQPSGARLGVYFVAGGAVTLCLAIGAFGLVRIQEPKVVPEGGNKDSDGLSEQVRNLSREVNLLRARQATTEERVRSPQRQGFEDEAADSSADPLTGNQQEGSESPPAVTPEEARARAAARYEFLDTTFQAEPRDATWSAATESEIARAFESEVLSGAALRSASCGSTMCKVEMSLASGTEFDGFQLEFSRILHESLPQGTMRQIESPDGGLKVVAYLARPNSRLPAWKPGD